METNHPYRIRDFTPLKNRMCAIKPVKSVQEYSAKVDKLGGKAIYPKQSLPSVGYIAASTDTENNTFGIFEVDQTAT
jgi:predicted enzyme related to lactoylglutathione lyase